MTNPNEIVRVRARNGGRASVYEANAWCQAYGAGLLSGNGVTQNTSADMNVLVGGTPSNPDVVIATNPFGYKIALDIVGQQAIQITAPTTNSRISSIVAYTDDLVLSSSDTTVTGSPSSCGLIVVNGTASASPSAPSDSDIRSAITADGATGSQACYAIIANVTVDAGMTTITNSEIAVEKARLLSSNVDYATLKTPAPDNNTLQSFTATYNTTKNYIANHRGFFMGKLFVSTNHKQAELKINGLPVAGLPFVNTGATTGQDQIMVQIRFCVPVAEGDTITLTATGGGFEELRLVGIRWV